MMGATRGENSWGNLGTYAANRYGLYVLHTECGFGFRALARLTGTHPSTVLRRVRKTEDAREDLLLDEYLTEFSVQFSQSVSNKWKRDAKMKKIMSDQNKLSKETLTVLRRLCETGAFLALAKDLEQGAILRTRNGQEPTRIGVVSRDLAKNLVLRDWITCTKKGRVMIYNVTDAGRASLRRAILGGDAKSTPNNGFAEAQSPFAGQHREFGDRNIMDRDDQKPRKMRVNLRESPLTILARKKERDGKLFLTPELLQAGERLREDFELAQLGQRVTQNWERFLTVSDTSNFGSGGAGGSSSAQARLHAALTFLGPGLGDIALRCCCFLEGLETAEKRMNWAARSGKIVLRIALQRLALHYKDYGQEMSRKIG